MADAPSAPPASGTERCGNAAACRALIVTAGGAGLCAGCRRVAYCRRECQRAAWGAHKVECKELQSHCAKAASGVPLIRGPVNMQGTFAATLAAARAGDAVAQFNVATMYMSGTLAVQSFASGWKWFARCAAQPAPPREEWAHLGDCYRHGRGVAADAEKAVRLFRVGAATGDAGAQFALAHCLDTGTGVAAPDFDAALALYTAAAAQDHAESIGNLGAYYASGRGVARDLPRAVALYKRVLAHPHALPTTVANAAFNLGLKYMKGDGVASNVEEGLRLLLRAAALGDETAPRLLRELGVLL